MTLSPNFFDVIWFFLSSLATGSSFMTILSLVLELWQFSFMKDWPEIQTTAWVLPNIWKLGQVRDTVFGAIVSNKMLLNATKCQGYSFYCFWVIKGKLTGNGKIPPTQIRVNRVLAKKHTPVQCNLCDSWVCIACNYLNLYI